MSGAKRDWTVAAANVAAVLAVALAGLVFLSGRFDRLTDRMDVFADRVESRFEAMDARIDALAESNARIEGALSELSKRVDGIEARMIAGGP